MKIGITAFITDNGMLPDELGTEIENRGFESLFLPEHSHIPVSRATPYPYGERLPDPYFRAWDPFVALAGAAVATKKLLLGTGVSLVAQRDTIQTAKEVSCIDQLSKGRFIFGVGTGWNYEEMKNHGVEPKIRGSLVDEKLNALKRIWTSDEAQFHGKHVSFDPIYQWPKPVQKPFPKIYVGGVGYAAVKRAVRLGMGWMPIGASTPCEVDSQLRIPSSLGEPGMPVTAALVQRDQEVLRRYAEWDVERVTFFLPPKNRSQSLHRLDELADLSVKHGFLTS